MSQTQSPNASYRHFNSTQKSPAIQGADYVSENSETLIFTGNEFLTRLVMYSAEFFGTCILTCAFGLCESSHSSPHSSPSPTRHLVSTRPLTSGAIMASMIYAFGYVSGGHFNPAITIAVFIRQFIGLYDTVAFIVSQLVGAFCGAYLSYAISGKVPLLEMGAAHSYQAALGEFVFTLAICLCVLNVETTEAIRGNSFYGLAIGLIIIGGGNSLANVSGGVFNPAMGTSLMLLQKIHQSKDISCVWVYWAGPIVGSILAGLCFLGMNHVAGFEDSNSGR